MAVYWLLLLLPPALAAAFTLRSSSWILSRRLRAAEGVGLDLPVDSSKLLTSNWRTQANYRKSSQP